MSCILLSDFLIFTHISLFVSPDLQNASSIHTYKYPWPDLSAANPLCRQYQGTIMAFVSVHGGGIHLNPLLGNNLHKLQHLLGDWRHKTNYTFRANVIAWSSAFVCVCADIVLWLRFTTLHAAWPPCNPVEFNTIGVGCKYQLWKLKFERQYQR